MLVRRYPYTSVYIRIFITTYSERSIIIISDPKKSFFLKKSLENALGDDYIYKNDK